MRPFEVLLFLSNIGLFITIFFLKSSIRKSALLITSGVSFIFLIIHFLVEGYRLQLLFPYCFTIFMLICSFIYYHKVVVIPRALHGIRLTSSIFIVMALVFTAGLMYVFPIFKLPTPTGDLKVGTQAFHFVDRERDEVFLDAAKGKRELMIQVWYPAENTSGKSSPLIPDTKIMNPMAKNYGLPGFTFEHLKYVLSHSYKDADISTVQSSYPLIVVNPGFGSSRFLHTSQAENLASQGYIVAVIDHTYNTFATVFPDGRMTSCETNKYFSAANDYDTETGNRDKVGKVLTEDVTFALNQFELMNSGEIRSNLKGKFDLEHIGVFGHSIGGATAYDSSYDARITAGINLDGGLYLLNDKMGLNKPFSFIFAESGFEKLKTIKNNYVYTDEELKKMGTTREWKDKEIQDKKIEIEHMRKVVDNGGQIMYIENLEHLNFTDVQFFSPIFKIFGATGKSDTKRADSIVNAYTLNFFDTFLKNKGVSFIEEQNSKYPEVKDVSSMFITEKE